MLRFLLVFLLIVVGCAAYLWMSFQSLPDWYTEGKSNHQQTASQLSKKIDEQGSESFLRDKLAGILLGEVVLTEDEFNSLLVASLLSNKDGRRVLAVSDAVHADLRDGEIEFGAVINMDKLGNVEPRAKRAFERAMKVLPLSSEEKIYVAVIGTPVARNGNLAIADDVRVQIGSIPISNRLLKQVGVPTHRLNEEDLPLRPLQIRSVASFDGEIRLGARPNF